MYHNQFQKEILWYGRSKQFLDARAAAGSEWPAAANSVWAKVDQRVTDLSPIITLFNPKLVDFVSKRLQGYQYNPQAGFLWDEASIR